MANQTVTTGTPTSPINYDDAAISGLLNGETITINGGAVRIDSDVRWNQQAAVMGAVTLSASLGGSFVIDGSQVWEVPFSASTGNVPTQGALNTNGVTGGTSGATGELLRVWATGSLEPATAGGAMPATGFIKLRSKTGTFQNGETITLPGGATITASSAGNRSWIHVVGREGTSCTVPRLGNQSITGDWYELGTTNGLDDQTFQFPVADECPAFQMETSPGSGTYEWWLNAGRRWVGQVQTSTQTVSGTTETANIATRPSYNDPAGFLNTFRQLKETATTAVHLTSVSLTAGATEAGIYTLRTYLKKDTRRYGFVQVSSGTSNADRYGVIIDFDAAGAVVATPTVGSPLNTSNTVTAITGGVYLVELTINVVNTTSTLSGFVGISNSATPTLVNGQPSYAGSTTEGIWYTELQLVAPSSIQYVSSTDERGKFFFSNPQTGVITLAQRTGRTAGLKPASGCKVRIPNVILSSSPSIDYTINTTPATGLSLRYGFSTGSAGSLSISHVTMNWLLSISSPFSVTLQNSATCGWSSSGAASTQTYSNLGMGITRDNSGAVLTISNTQSGGTISDVRVCRDSGSASPVNITSFANATFSNVRAETFGGLQGRIGKFSVGNGFALTSCSDITIENPIIVGNLITATTCSNITILNAKYAERVIGDTTTADAGTAIQFLSGCNSCTVDGFETISGLTNVHPNTAIVAASASNDIDVRNIGTLAAPFNGGSTAQMGNIVRFTGTVFNSSGRRLYADNLSSVAVSNNATNQNISWINVWGDGADTFNGATGLNVIAQGCRWSHSGNVQSATYGVHWEDAFTSTTSGRITVSANEPLPSTADQCTSTFGVNAGFTSAGNAAMPNVGDEIIWTMPYYALGHTGIAQFGYGASATETWLLNGTNRQNFEFTYQIDTGTGFSAWKTFLNIARRSSGGVAGTNTITVTAADWDAMTTKPVVGDYVVIETGTRLPANTTITNIAGYVLTLSNNFITSVGTEILFFYKNIRDEVISSTTGYKLKIKIRTNTANSSNLFSNLRIPFDTNSTAQQEQYPLPTTQAEASVSGVQPDSRIQVYNVTTSTEVANEVLVGSSWSLLYDDGTSFTDGDTVRIRVVKLGYLPQVLFAVATATGFAALANQETDSIYTLNAIDGDTVTEFTADYPNVQLDISDPDGITTVQRIYAWLRYTETTEQGIDLWFDVVTPTDSVNYLIDAAKLNLKLDNTSGAPVQIVGGRIYRSDDAGIIASSSGSIQMDPSRVYAITVGSAVLPADIVAIADAVWSENISTYSGNEAGSSLKRIELLTKLKSVE